MEAQTRRFKTNAREAMADGQLAEALTRLGQGFPLRRAEAIERLPEFDALRDAAKAIKTFAKDHKALVIKGGYMDGAILTPQDFAKFADLESREVLLAKLAGMMKAKQSQAASLFAAPAGVAAPPTTTDW